MAIRKDINILFSGTNAEASALSGWVRNTDFDTKYILGCSSTDTSGGGTGGTTTHTHSIAFAHIHTLSSATSSGSANDDAGVSAIANTGHSQGASSLSSVTPTVGNANNQPPYYKLIIIKSLGTSLNLPAKGVVLTDNPQYDPSPFGANFAIADGTGGIPDLIHANQYFPLGADAGGNAGGTGGSSTHYHDFTHSHTSPATSGASSNITARNTRGSGIAGSHTHTVTISNLSAGNYDSQAVDGNPPNIVAVPWYVSADTPLETDIIGMWTGAKSAIPDNWTEVEGYRDYFVRFTSGSEESEGTFSDIDDTAGSDQHNHTSNHTHSGATASILGTQYLSYLGGSIAVSAYIHSHSWTISTSSANFAFNTSKTNYPPYIKVYFIKYTAPTITPGAYYNGTYYDATLYKN